MRENGTFGADVYQIEQRGGFDFPCIQLKAYIIIYDQLQNIEFLSCRDFTLASTLLVLWPVPSQISGDQLNRTPLYRSSISDFSERQVHETNNCCRGPCIWVFSSICWYMKGGKCCSKSDPGKQFSCLLHTKKTAVNYADKVRRKELKNNRCYSPPTPLTFNLLPQTQYK